MANFNTHLTVAITSGTITSGICWYLNYVSLCEAVAYSLLTLIGGILPDLDADNSKPLRLLFFCLACICASITVSMAYTHFTLLILTLIWMLVYILVKYVLFAIFIRLTVHRGVFHSLLAVVFMIFLVTYCAYYFLLLNIKQSWWSGAFVGLGYFVHLSLDEIYSVDLLNSRLKRSFGSALKVCSLNNPEASILMLIFSIFLFTELPAPPGINYVPFVTRIKSLTVNYIKF